jgi:hypothetical protein
MIDLDALDLTNVVLHLTTVDNPYDLMKEFDSWYAYDLDQGRDTLAYLDRVYTSIGGNLDSDDEDFQQFLYNKAIKYILEDDMEQLYKLYEPIGGM